MELSDSDVKEYYKRILPLVEALIRGETIQYKGKRAKEWTDVQYPSFTPSDRTIIEALNLEYRIKPKEITRKMYCNIYDGQIFGHLSKEKADTLRNTLCIACKEIEITYTEGEGL